ncbi:type I-A CRISPR-associated protein Cas4/Csa1 [Candidatus Marsarchaeota G1 archaeon OSP_D]|uniref:Type I-A CRISPR-associated protein Cas4/Csa1 n=3 Tax=Candidatus Marsarchaeota group 1 TaxID=2203770 RepID=A0A2R6A873_9ARCH|nr:MAG: type I-A CRISPR-associated protein Cas4/Csa1 [Candidatus Marsarchaeota G1 archaeon BE_D]PSN83060.1 MAG: type I-A CRISPR-associated protein Cas4/Csa1 [Candidatus Marsarchaeota G1 archaeon OSP_D]PSN87893.1 MAG: type I-A CRISPR-associated protein Cas4/Csa1 [Candidatus Marsarchaeota G1 archaeon OSP_C]
MVSLSVYYSLEQVNEWVRVANTKSVQVSDEMRGWRWHDYPLQPAYSAQLGVSDITNGLCDSFRYVYLKYVERIRQKDNEELQKGSLLHEMHSKANEAAKRNILKIHWERGKLTPESFHESFVQDKQKVVEQAKSKYTLIPQEELERAVNTLWTRAAINYGAALNSALSVSKHLESPDPLIALVAPVITEYPIDGTKVGLTQAIRADGFIPPGIIVEIKTHPPLEANKYALAGYALAYEAQHNSPVNYGVFVHVEYDWKTGSFTVHPKITPITDEMRQGFIEMRDQAQKIVAQKIDPRLPPKCNSRCPYLKHCNPP